MSSILYRIKLFTGPLEVGYVAAGLRTAGYDVVCEGTEHVYFECFDCADGYGANGAMAGVFADLDMPFDYRWSVVSTR